ncbi:MAG: hypothetical protein HQK66_00030 [Desulfamplus sp.]|nr:hypothetical protein [Desulfamplus sp.]
MKRQVVLRILLIGMLHSFLYLWFVPFVVFPMFGSHGILTTVLIALLVSVALFCSMS